MHKLEKENPVKEFDEFVSIVKRLRNECPWDMVQTHSSIRGGLLEETYEVLEAIDSENPEELKKELGDVLLQVVFHSNIAEGNGDFKLADVIKFETEKMIRRHPHVFGDVKISGSEEALTSWEKIKNQEGRSSALEGVPKELPALLKAYRIQEKASKVGFDWKDINPVFDKITEEINELKVDIDNKEPQKKIEEEFGDLLFSLVNYARFIKVNPEDSLREASEKFMRRFTQVEKYAMDSGRKMEEMTLEEMDEIWDKVKKDEK
jgi:MazG family protein